MIDTPHAVISGHQRSGTHLLLSLLASHPEIHGRGECVLQHLRGRRGERADHPIFTNCPDHLNVAIIMYSEVAPFERLCAPLHQCKLIHLLRRPLDIALSIEQMEANRVLYGSAFRAHSRIGEATIEHAPIKARAVNARERRVRATQEAFVQRLKSHPGALAISYEDITNNAQVNLLSESTGRRLLEYLGLAYFPLSTTLRKTGSSVAMVGDALARCQI